MTSPCLHFTEHPHWRDNPNLSRGVTFDGWCSRCGFSIQDAKLDDRRGVGITQGGRRIALVSRRVVVGGVPFTSDTPVALCSECCPQILS